MERNYQLWHAKAEAALEADARQAEEKAAADAEAQRSRWGMTCTFRLNGSAALLCYLVGGIECLPAAWCQCCFSPHLPNKRG
jgi:hypothetical protein